MAHGAAGGGTRRAGRTRDADGHTDTNRKTLVGPGFCWARRRRDVPGTSSKVAKSEEVGLEKA